MQPITTCDLTEVMSDFYRIVHFHIKKVSVKGERFTKIKLIGVKHWHRNVGSVHEWLTSRVKMKQRRGRCDALQSNEMLERFCAETGHVVLNPWAYDEAGRLPPLSSNNSKSFWAWRHVELIHSLAFTFSQTDPVELISLVGLSAAVVGR